VPRIVPKHGILLPSAPTRLARRPHADILDETRGYAREQYIPRQPICDAVAQRKQDQLLFEFGKKRLEEMHKLAVEQEQHQSASRPSQSNQDMRDELISQVCNRSAAGRQFDTLES
jgi:hypothetical protein